jgi:hypothetical protein
MDAKLRANRVGFQEPSARIPIGVWRGWPVPDRSDEFRKAARECLELARKTTNVSTRAALLTMAQRSLDLASGSAADDQLKALLRELNDQKMSGQD